MKKLFKSKVTSKGILAQVLIFNKAKRFLAVIGIIGMLWNYIPWQHINADEMNQEIIELATEDIEINDMIEYPTTTDLDFDPYGVEVVSEVTENRTLTSKTFRKEDGTYEKVIYNDVIHYENDGTLIQVDNSLNDIGEEL